MHDKRIKLARRGAGGLTDFACARAHAQLWAELARAGTLIGPHDLWLAATCVAHGLTMVTGNVREFARCPRSVGQNQGVVVVTR